MNDKVLYFGYGANRDPRMICAILGKSEMELVGRQATLEGYGLAIQNLDQIPNKVLDSAPVPISPRDMLKDWGEDFTSYVIYPDEGGKVQGTVWELTSEERERIRDWELVDFGWYKDCEGRAVLEGQEIHVISEMLGDGQQIDRKVDGLHYETWLHDPARFEAIATKTRHEYDDRLRADGPNRERKNV